MENNLEIQALVDAVRDGFADPLETLASFKELIDIYTEASKQIKSEALAECEKYGKEGKSYHGYHITIKNTGDRLDYSKDDVWNSFTEAAKTRAKLVKLASKDGAEIFDVDGVKVDGVPIKTPGGETLNFKYIK